MQIYLPIAKMSVDVFVILGLGGAIGFLSGMFGAGGG
ncbi:MAG: sulfite exporter TauE/SafE family protein, partial [Alphaproteobacteria bacterium]|nr:sulfite exporter TauE/SafE family protein [Alphaproteobacteria bacterium]